MDIVAELKKIREEQGLNYFQASKRAGVYSHNIKAIESGARPYLHTVQHLAEAYGYELVLVKKKE